mmetsp:Transcript_65327/g.103505  ORF Transcript_65327/g.103505 Transcript_65327/m.103505 type:complete len:80 (+) Transcript_65327:77-316(+)
MPGQSLVLAAVVFACLVVSTASLGENPACWFNWQVLVEKGGTQTEEDACMTYDWVKIVNVVIFYVMFWFLVRVMVLSTQ